MNTKRPSTQNQSHQAWRCWCSVAGRSAQGEQDHPRDKVSASRTLSLAPCGCVPILRSLHYAHFQFNAHFPHHYLLSVWDRTTLEMKEWHRWPRRSKRTRHFARLSTFSVRCTTLCWPLRHAIKFCQHSLRPTSIATLPHVSLNHNEIGAAGASSLAQALKSKRAAMYSID
jgi:hypothetical protein